MAACGEFSPGDAALPLSGVRVALPSGTYTVGVVYIGYYDNGREFETEPMPVAVEVDAAGAGYSCLAPDVIVCGTGQQNLLACGTP